MPFGEITLNDGKKIPAIAFGTGSIYKFKDVTQLVHQALDAGFWHIDTAQYYQTEAYIGQAIYESGLARDEFYIATKLGPGQTRVLEQLKISLANLRVSYVDLYLIHQPDSTPDLDGVWRQFEASQKDGLIKTIGVSNFSLQQLQSLVKNARVLPAVNQIELHPYNYARQKAVIEWAAERGIVTEAYSSLSSITKFPGGPVDAPVAAAAERLGVTPTQVLLSWVRAKGAVIVTTTSSKARLQEYLAVGDLPPLPESDIAAIDAAGARGPPGILDHRVLSVRGMSLNLKTVLLALLVLVFTAGVLIQSCHQLI